MISLSLSLSLSFSLSLFSLPLLLFSFLSLFRSLWRLNRRFWWRLVRRCFKIWTLYIGNQGPQPKRKLWSKTWYEYVTLFRRRFKIEKKSCYNFCTTLSLSDTKIYIVNYIFHKKIFFKNLKIKNLDLVLLLVEFFSVFSKH